MIEKIGKFLIHVGLYAISFLLIDHFVAPRNVATSSREWFVILLAAIVGLIGGTFNDA